MIIDTHHHIEDEQDYADRLVDACDRLDIDWVCLVGLPDWFWQGVSANTKIEAAFRKHPQHFIGFAFIMLGEDGPDQVSEYFDRGFRGLKFDFPPANYDDPRFFPIFERAATLGMPMLFHTGMTVRDESLRHRYTSAQFMRPVYLDTIAATFPQANIIMAHAGNPWLDEAAMALRLNPNLYSDLTGSTLKYRTPDRLRSVLWWGPDKPYGDKFGRHAFEKIVFGSDVHLDEYGDIIGDYRNLMDALSLPSAVRQAIWGKTMARLLGLDD